MLDTPLQRRENSPLIAFLKAHSGRPAWDGDQCDQHAPIREMLGGEIRQALIGHGLRPYSRQHIFNECQKLEMDTRGKKGPRRVISDQERLRRGRSRWALWYTATKADPSRYAAYQKKEREKHRRRKPAGGAA